MWNDTDTPLAHLITFRSYGTWLHGDDRGSVDRHHNRYGTPYIAPNERWWRHNLIRLKSPPLILDTAQRSAVEFAVRDTCTRRKWPLFAFNIRTNHVHVVVSIGETKADAALGALKANATREMRKRGCWRSRAQSLGCQG